MDILELIQGGERDFIEFKETLRWDTRLLSKNPALEKEARSSWAFRMMVLSKVKREASQTDKCPNNSLARLNSKRAMGH